MVAAAALERVLKQGSQQQQLNHLEAVKKGHIRHLRINLASSTGDATAPNVADTTENLRDTLTALNPESCEMLSICTRLSFVPTELTRLAALAELHLEHCVGVTQVPNFSHLVVLRKLHLGGCTKLLQLSDLPITLEELDIHGCIQLQHLPSNLNSLIQLRCLHASGCSSLASLPDKLAANLTELNLSRCVNLRTLSQTVSSLAALTALNLEGCKRLQSLPEHFGDLEQLRKLNLCNSKLSQLPDLSAIAGLTQVDSGLSSNKDGVVYVHGLCRKLVRSWQGSGYAPGCSNGLGWGYGIHTCLMPWVKPKCCQTCVVCKFGQHVDGDPPEVSILSIVFLFECVDWSCTSYIHTAVAGVKLT